MGIIQNIFKRKDANKLSLKQRIIIQEANELSDEEAIENVKRESEYYRNAKAVEEVVKKILNEHKIMIPPTFETDDISLNRAKAILDVKGLSMPDIQLEEPVITRNDIKAGLYRAYMGLDGLLEYYNATSEERAENRKIFKDLNDLDAQVWATGLDINIFQNIPNALFVTCQNGRISNIVKARN